MKLKDAIVLANRKYGYQNNPCSYTYEDGYGTPNQVLVRLRKHRTAAKMPVTSSEGLSCEPSGSRASE